MLLAVLAGLISGATLLIGALIAWFVDVPQRLVAAIMAFGAGVLISAAAFDLVEEAIQTGSFWTGMSGFLAGAIVYVVADVVLDSVGARRRRGASGGSGTGLGIALGALLDGIPETAVQGVALASNGHLPIAVVAAVAISNLPEGLSSTADMKSDRRSPRYVFGVWSAIAAVCAASAWAGYVLLGGAPDGVTSFVTAFAGGAILAMIADTMLPEAFGKAGPWTGLIAVVGFIVSYGIHTVGG